jgi:glycosyltransferase involved in cell wall biosynthesis
LDGGAHQAGKKFGAVSRREIEDNASKPPLKLEMVREQHSLTGTMTDKVSRERLLDNAGGHLREQPAGIAAQTRPLHLLIVSNTHDSSHIYGADRDWVNLLNALGPKRVRVTWAGVSGTELLLRYFDKQLDVRIVNLNFYPFYEFLREHMYRRRTLLNWAGVARVYLKGLRRPLKQLGDVLAADPPDVVVTSTSVVLVGAAYALRRRLPHVWSVKEFLDPTVTACRNYARLIERLSEAVIVPSEAVAEVFSPRAHVLPDGSDLAAIRAGVRGDRAWVLESLDLPAEQLVVAQVGTISHFKGQHITMKALALMAAEGRDPCSLLFLGRAELEEKERLRAILAGAPTAWRESIRFAEFGPGDYTYLAAADVVVHPSVLPDPYPNAVREAMALSKPVVGTRSGGIPQLVADGETGLLVEPDDAPALVAALKNLLDSPERRARMGEAALHFAAEKLDVHACKHSFYDLLVGVLRRGH